MLDLPDPDDTRTQVLTIVALVDEDYFYASPGNTPLEIKENKYKKMSATMC